MKDIFDIHRETSEECKARFDNKLASVDSMRGRASQAIGLGEYKTGIDLIRRSQAVSFEATVNRAKRTTTVTFFGRKFEL